MKMVVLMSIEEEAERLRRLLTQAGVLVYSEMEMKGFRRVGAADERQNWFVHGQHPTYSHLVFTVVQKEKAAQLVDAIRRESEQQETPSPVHALVVNVEEFI